MSTIGQRVQAMAIYKNIEKIKKDAFDELKKIEFFERIQKSYDDLFANNKIDLETARILKMFFDNSTELNKEFSIISEPILQAIDRVTKILELAEKNNDSGPVTVMLTDDGTMTCHLKKDGRYSMKKGSLNYRILKLLTRDYTETNKIQHATGSKSVESIRKAVGKINGSVKRSLKLEHFIESKPGDGYRVNNIYNLIKLQ